MRRGSKRGRSGAGGWRSWGAGGVATCGSAAERERERAVGEEGEGTDKRASLVGEIEGKGGERPAGPRPRKGRGRRGGGVGPKGRVQGEEGEREIPFSLFF